MDTLDRAINFVKRAQPHYKSFDYPGLSRLQEVQLNYAKDPAAWKPPGILIGKKLLDAYRIAGRLQPGVSSMAYGLPSLVNLSSREQVSLNKWFKEQASKPLGMGTFRQLLSALGMEK